MGHRLKHLAHRGVRRKADRDCSLNPSIDPPLPSSLLDMQVSNEELLEKYNLKANDAILAEGKQKEM